MEIVWTDKAIECYNDVIDYSLEHFGRFPTLDLTKKVNNAVTKIKMFPSASPLIPHESHDGSTFRYVTIKGPLQLIYQEEENVCTILAIWNTKRHPSSLKAIISSQR